MDGWERYKRMTALTDDTRDLTRIKDELRECCGKNLNTRLVQLHGQEALGKCDEGKLLEFVKAVALRGVHKEVHRANFQLMHQNTGELYSS